MSDASVQVGAVAAALGLYTIIPVSVGLLCWGEHKSRGKYLGIGLSLVAVVLLGISSGSKSAGASGDSPSGTDIGALGRVLAFLSTFVLWGLCDVLSARVRLDAFSTALSMVVGQLACASVLAFVSFAKSVGTTGGVGPGSVVSPPFGLGHCIVLFGNCLGIIGWMAFVRLGQIGQASSFTPIVNLYTYISVVLSVLFLGEQVTALKVAGFGLAAAAVVLISRDWRPATQDNSSDIRSSNVVANANGDVEAAAVQDAASGRVPSTGEWAEPGSHIAYKGSVALAQYPANGASTGWEKQGSPTPLLSHTTPDVAHVPSVVSEES
jgi:drug/metabolite transporter (DMT)-like permease